MKRKYHHIALFNYNGKLMIYECIEARQLFVGDFLSMLVKDFPRADITNNPLTDLEIIVNDEQVLFLPSFIISMDNPLLKQSTGSACAPRR